MKDPDMELRGIKLQNYSTKNKTAHQQQNWGLFMPLEERQKFDRTKYLVKGEHEMQRHELAEIQKIYTAIEDGKDGSDAMFKEQREKIEAEFRKEVLDLQPQRFEMIRHMWKKRKTQKINREALLDAIKESDQIT